MATYGTSPEQEPPFAETGSGPAVVSLTIDADWRAADLVSLISALEQMYDVFLAVGLDQESGGGNLEAIASHLEDLLPDSGLAIPSMRFASKGVISLEGSGEIPHEARGFLTDLETIGQRRKANRLELQIKELEVATRRQELEINSEQDEHDLARRIQQDQLELVQMRQQICRWISNSPTSTWH
jgi:hypothetical protein